MAQRLAHVQVAGIIDGISGGGLAYRYVAGLDLESKYMSNDLKTPEGRTARCDADMVRLQLEVGISLTEPERKVYALAWRDGCMAALEHARNELVLCWEESVKANPPQRVV